MRLCVFITSSLSALVISQPTFAQSSAANNEIVVTGQRAQQANAIAEKRSALGIIDVASADEIGQLPDNNVAEVVERLPGVGVQYDQGEGRFVSIRGVPAELNGYTVNGFELGNPDGDTRALPLDVISGQLLNRIEVSKVKTSDLLGQGIGGTINLVTQTAFDFDRPFIFSANGKVGYQELREGSQPIEGDVTIGGRFGADEEFGILLGASYSDRTFTSFGFFPDDWFEVPEAARGALPSNIKYTDYRLNRERIGASGSLDWRGGATELYIRGIYSIFKEDEYRQRLRIDFDDAVLDPGGVTGSATDTEQRSDLRLEQKEKSVLAIMAGGSSEIGSDWIIDYGAAFVHNEVREPNQSWQFRGNPGPVSLDFSDRLYTVIPDNGFLEPSDLGFRSFTAQDDSGDEDIWQGRLDFTRNLALGEDSFLKFGANIRLTDKSFDAETANYGRGDADNRFTLDGLSGPDVTVFPRSGRGYRITPVIDEFLIQDFTNANLNGPLFVFDDGDTLEDGTLDDFSLDENIYAGYMMANLDFGEIAVTAGLRVERTELDITGFRLDEETTTVLPATERKRYTDFLPSIVVRISPADDVIFRAAYSRSIGRPQYADLSPGGAISFDLSDTGIVEGSASLGNADLDPFVADSFDMTAEWYFAPGGLLSLGAFAKFIDNPIFTETLTLFDTSFAGRDYDILRFSQPQNAEQGDIIGLEAAYQQQFTMLPGLLSGLGVNLNVTFIDSNLRVPDRKNGGFPEQSDLLWGAQLFYQKGPVEASVAYNHTGRAPIGISGAPVTDEYNDDLRRLDAKIAFDVTDNIRIFAEGKNLTDEPTRQYQGEDFRDRVIQQERYGRTYYAGVSVRW
ncbi:TonB-dependent receptor [Parasphingorhabdus cellanae]|uniref:TonB-dependent receptor n=1 Tax=Parasphingorhabdus cellanae TaxID=2806553 RepID=A0ABX7TAW6_9SPHN|nr:TonB-dependent receptor [Parasphingorhabdus cellanae]QTD57418.1 TonB-dependent receptor [Parasphingorhabdus cellanae]